MVKQVGLSDNALSRVRFLTFFITQGAGRWFIRSLLSLISISFSVISASSLAIELSAFNRKEFPAETLGSIVLDRQKSIVDHEIMINELETMIQNNSQLRLAREEGIDLEMLWYNLQRSVTERIRRHQIAFDTVRMLKRAHRK